MTATAKKKYTAKPKDAKAQLARREIVSELRMQCRSMPEIRREVMRRLGLKSYSLQTVFKDVHACLDEWREHRLKNTDEYVAQQLAKCDYMVMSLWRQWEQSTRHLSWKDQTSAKEDEDSDSRRVPLGNPAYIAEIRKWEEMRNRLLGLGPPDVNMVNFVQMPERVVHVIDGTEVTRAASEL